MFQSIKIQLYEKQKNVQEVVQARLLIQLLNILSVFQIIIIYTAGSSYIKLPKELDYIRKVLINIQNIDGNECL